MGRKVGKKGAGKNAGDNGSALVVYKGPIKLNKGNASPLIYRTNLNCIYVVNSNSASFLELSYTTANVTGSTEWTTLAQNWREYRVLGMQVDYRCLNDKSYNSSRYAGLGCIAPYHGAVPAWAGSVTSSTTNSVLNMEGSMPFHACENKLVKWRMADIEESQYFNTGASPVIVGGVYGEIGTLSASTTYGYVYLTFLVEFKGRV